MAQKATSLTFPDQPRNLKIGAELNRGAWGAVYNGELEGRSVAVKRIHELLHLGGGVEERRKLFEDFREECKKLQSLSHPHVVGFIGAFNDPRLGPILVMEKMQENLRQFLDKCKKKLPLAQQLRIALEIIRGVAYLHQQIPPLVHRDLNDKNVMFSTEGVIKIGDFGQSKLKKDLYLTSGQPGMVTFMPPEALTVNKSKYNESLDIFSVGVLMLEIGTQQGPLKNLHGIGIIPEVERRECDLKALGEEHPLKQPVLLCLKDNPKERPKASDLQRDVLALVDGVVEATASDLRSQITTLQAALKGEIAARKEHEAKLTSQFQSVVASHVANIRQLEEKCELLEAQAMTYKLDFQQERSDRENAIGRFDEERETLQADIAKLNIQLAAVKKHDDTSAQLQQMKELSLLTKNESPLPPSLGKEVCSIKLPDMPMVAVSFGATIHNGKVYISTIDDDDEFRVLVYSTNEQKWNVMEGTEQHQHQGSAITLVNDHITLIGGVDMKADIPTTTPSTWYEEEGQWKQVLPPMPTGRLCGTVISHDNLLLVTGGVAEDDSTVLNTTDVLDLTTMKWTTPEGLNLPVPLWWHHVALCGEYLYLVGGMKVFERQEDSNSSEDSDSSEDVNSQAWRAKWSDVKQTAAPQHSQPQKSVWTRIADPPVLRPTLVSCGGTLYSVGGGKASEGMCNGVNTYIPARNQWIAVGDMSVERAGHCAVPLSSNTIFVAGGLSINGDNILMSPSTELLLL